MSKYLVDLLKEDKITKGLLASTILPLKGGKSLTPKSTAYRVGFEFENETKIPFEMQLPSGWKFVKENSLKFNGFEAVSAKNVSYADSAGHVGTLFKSFSEAISLDKFTNSLRTSTHIHQDVRMLSYLDLLKNLAVYWIMEPFIQYFAGPHRQANHFCLRLNDTKGVPLNLCTIHEKGYSWNDSWFFTENARYSSMNLNSVRKFGSIENRLMRGVSNQEDALTWAAILHAIRVYALSKPDLASVQNSFLKDCSASEYPLLVLGKELYEECLDYFPNDLSVATEIRQGYLNVLPLFKTFKNYTKDAVEEVLPLLEEIDNETNNSEIFKFLASAPDTNLVNPTPTPSFVQTPYALLDVAIPSFQNEKVPFSLSHGTPGTMTPLINPENFKAYITEVKELLTQTTQGKEVVKRWKNPANPIFGPGVASTLYNIRQSLHLSAFGLFLIYVVQGAITHISDLTTYRKYLADAIDNLIRYHGAIGTLQRSFANQLYPSFEQVYNSYIKAEMHTSVVQSYIDLACKSAASAYLLKNPDLEYSNAIYKSIWDKYFCTGDSVSIHEMKSRILMTIWKNTGISKDIKEYAESKKKVKTSSPAMVAVDDATDYYADDEGEPE